MKHSVAVFVANLLAVAGVGLCVYYYVNALYQYRTALPCEATVVEVIQWRDAENSTHYDAKVEYQVEGVTYRGTISYVGRHCKAGDRMEIRVLAHRHRIIAEKPSLVEVLLYCAAIAVIRYIWKYSAPW